MKKCQILCRSACLFIAASQRKTEEIKKNIKKRIITILLTNRRITLSHFDEHHHADGDENGNCHFSNHFDKSSSLSKINMQFYFIPIDIHAVTSLITVRTSLIIYPNSKRT